jgi:hypothetical protein
MKMTCARRGPDCALGMFFERMQGQSSKGLLILAAGDIVLARRRNGLIIKRIVGPEL